ncbi:MAG: hypothetical protein DRP45_01555, partial [Candidatus Zixiibacteriota bacterium]
MISKCRIRLLSLSMLVLISVTVIYIPGFSNSLDLKTQFQSELEALYDQYRFPGVTAAYILPDGTVGAFAVG